MLLCVVAVVWLLLCCGEERTHGQMTTMPVRRLVESAFFSACLRVRLPHLLVYPITFTFPSSSGSEMQT